MLVELFGHALDEDGLGLAVVPGAELGPLLGLGLLHEGQQVVWEQGEFAAVGGGVLQVRTHGPAVAAKIGAELVLKDAFGVDVGEFGHVGFVLVDVGPLMETLCLCVGHQARGMQGLCGTPKLNRGTSAPAPRNASAEKQL